MRSVSDQPCSKAGRKINQLKPLFKCSSGTQHFPKHCRGERSAGCLPCPQGAGGLGEETDLPHIQSLVQSSFRILSITALQLANSLSSGPPVGSRAPPQCPPRPPVLPHQCSSHPTLSPPVCLSVSPTSVYAWSRILSIQHRVRPRAGPQVCHSFIHSRTHI